ncbi:MAG: YkgJ family cysteine cluster protein [Verrucomicrobiales bacterium]
MSEQAESDVVRIYAEVDSLVAEHSHDCQARTTCCHFLQTGKAPMLTAGEALVAARAVRASGRKKLPASTDPKSGRCPLLGKDDACTIYASRPLGCRTHFCSAAGGPLPRRILQHLIRRLEAIAESLGDTDPRAIGPALSSALDLIGRKR